VTPGHTKRLFEAIEAGRISVVTQILDAEPAALEVAGQHKATCRDKTPLMYALQCHRFGIATELLRRGANAGARMTGGPRTSVIALAVGFAIVGRDQRELLQFVDRLIDAGADPNDALWPACHAYHKRLDNSECIELLLARGADPDHTIEIIGDSVRHLMQINARLYSARVLALFGIPDPTPTV